jgi:hypothetical protein
MFPDLFGYDELVALERYGYVELESIDELYRKIRAIYLTMRFRHQRKNLERMRDSRDIIRPKLGSER